MHRSLTRRLSDQARPYCDGRGWVAGVWLRWRFIVASAFFTFVVSNGCEKVVASLPWPSIAAVAPEIGVSWKGSIIQAVVLAVFSGASHIAQSTPRQSFSRHGRG